MLVILHDDYCGWNELFCIFKAMEILVEWQIPALKNIYGTDVMTTNIWDTAMTTVGTTANPCAAVLLLFCFICVFLLFSLLQMSCCGFFNYTDFVGSKFEAQNQGNLPPSCCGAGIDLCSCDEAERRLVKASKKHHNHVQFKKKQKNTKINRKYICNESNESH